MMSKFHLEFNGFAGFETLAEARNAAAVLRDVLKDAEFDNAGLVIRDMFSQRNVNVVDVSEDSSSYTYGLQGCKAYIGKLVTVAGKFMKPEEFDIIDWQGSLLKIDNQRYWVDIQVFKDIVTWGLKTAFTVEDFISSIPEQA